MSKYEPGDRVWVEMEGYPWWPARVISEEMLLEVTGSRRKENTDVAVICYAGSTSPECVFELHSHYDHARICFFETSSEKAVTTDEDLMVAIQNAAADTEAKPLKTAQALAISTSTVTGPAVSRSTASAAAAKFAPVKRARDEVAEQSAAAAASCVYLRSEQLRDLAAKINAAVAEDDLASVRILMCDLDNVDVPPSDLAETKIGVAVGGILGSRSCKPLWPLCRAMISFWARQLPEETLRAIVETQKNRRDKQDLRDHQSPTSPAYGSPTFGSPMFTFPHGGAAAPDSAVHAGSPSFAAALAGSPSQSQPSQPAKSFQTNLRRILDNPLSSTAFPAETIDKVARELVKAVQLVDDRQLLLTRLNNRDLEFVRENLLSGKWTAKEYLEQPVEVFMTQREKLDEQRRLREKIEAEENAKLANVNITETLFTCKVCGKKRCSFYEQQTRGADEPTTKFITCLECKTSWSEE